MTNFDYKKYSLENLENWMHDAMSAGEASPQEIYDVIKGVVEENYHHHKHHVSKAYELLALLNGNGGWTVGDVLKEREYYEPSTPPLSCDKDDPSPECKGAWNDFWEDQQTQSDLDIIKKQVEDNGGYDWTPPMEHSKHYYDYNRNDPNRPNPFVDKVVKWQLPVEYIDDEHFVSFPDDLLEAANLKEGDTVEWVDNKDGSFTLLKV